MQLKPDLLIYVKRMENGVWPDGKELNPVGDIAAHLDVLRAENAAIAQAIGQEPDFAFEEEVIRYHSEYSPDKNAALEYHRADA